MSAGMREQLAIPAELRDKVIAAWELSVEQLPQSMSGTAEFWRVSAERAEALVEAYGELLSVASDRLLIPLCVDARAAARAEAWKCRRELERRECAGAIADEALPKGAGHE